MDKLNFFHIHTDGGARGNPGPGAIGVYIESCSYVIPIKSFANENLTQPLLDYNFSSPSYQMIDDISIACHSCQNVEKLMVTAYGKSIGICTNNFAEYSAVESAFSYLLKNKNLINNKKDFILCCLDSLLVVKQLKGEYKIKDKLLVQKANIIKGIIYNLNCPVFFLHVKRVLNQKADKLVNQALDI